MENNFSEELNKNEGQDNNKHSKIIKLSTYFREWFVDYASYVIMDRAIPNLLDGLKPVQRRILHAMYKMNDGRYTKVANIIGQTMQYHPHGDAAIGDALVQLGQKDLLIDTQGNWGNIYTGDPAAAPRYIEARLSKFALEVLFSPKVTEWVDSYDGRNKEPVVLPVKFPLLLVLGVEGIAVGLASKIYPHNFNEIIDAAIKYLKGEDFELYPDFPTGGYADVTKYNEGLRGGVIKVRAKIKKLDARTLVITEIPFSTTTNSLIDSIIKANEKGKIKIKKIDDNTAENVEIVIHLPSGVNADVAIDALYAFTDCEVSLYPNSTVIYQNRPQFLSVKDLLKISVDNTREILRKEFEIKLDELEQAWHFANLERIFVEKRIYRKIEEITVEEEIFSEILKGLEPYKDIFKREITREDLVRLTEIKIRRISRYDIEKFYKDIEKIEQQIEEIKYNLSHLTDYTIKYFEKIKEKYGKGRERKTELKNFEEIEQARVVVRNQKLYVNRKDGYIGTSLTKDEFVTECSDIDDVIVFLQNGKYLVTKVSDKAFVGKNIIHIGLFNKNEKRTIYNVIYRDGRFGNIYAKRFAVTGVIRDKWYDVTKGTENSKVLYFSANPNGEAEIVSVFLKPRPRLKKLVFDFDFANLAIKSRGAQGNIVTKHEVHKVVLKEKGKSTLGGVKIWFDAEVNRLNDKESGVYLGEFFDDDTIITFYENGEFKRYSYDLHTHFEHGLMHIEKYSPDKVYTLFYKDTESGYVYVKRFSVKESEKSGSFLGEGNELIRIFYGNDVGVVYKTKNKRGDISEYSEFIPEFIGVKGYSTKGKRLTDKEIVEINFEEVKKEDDENEAVESQEDISIDDVKLFDDDNL
jgi:topoisomerase-4 subunit A